MYERFYGLKGKPFQLSPDPQFLFKSQGHSRALAYLHYGIQQGEGFVVVTGEVGTGKTTLAQTLFNELNRSRSIVVAHLVMSPFQGEDLLERIAEAFGLPPKGHSQATLIGALEDYLRKRSRARKRAILLLDEVQNLPFSGLETLRMLSNFQEGQRPLLQSLLLGQAEFRLALQRPNLEQVRQRVIASCHLAPFQEEETQDYIRHRLEQVKWAGDPQFWPKAFPRIHYYTRGIPRRINTFCDRLLLFAYLEGLHTISRETVDAVAEEIAGDLPGSTEETAWEEAQTAPPESSDRLAHLEERVRLLEEALRCTQASLNQAFPNSTRNEGQ